MDNEYKTGMLPWVLHILGLVSCGIFTFIGLVYVRHGDVWIPAFSSLLIVIALFFIVDFMVRFKIKKRKQADYMPELILGLGYLLVALVSFFYIFHFIDVDFSRKSELKREGLQKLAALHDLRNSYDTAVLMDLNSYRTGVETDMRNYLAASGSQRRQYIDSLNKRFPGAINFHASNADFQSQIHQLTDANAAIRKSKLSIENLYPEYVAYEEKVTPVFDHWQFIKVSYYFGDVDLRYSQLLVAAQLKMPTFNSHYQTSSVNLDDPSATLSNASGAELLVGAILFILIYGCILAPYIAAARYFNTLRRAKTPYRAPDTAIKLDNN